jgi:NAD(P)-dependent dehydrogenase (short-subunit alcohol dehydrogenase family)
MNYFANKVVLVTGAGNGLGRRLSIDLAHEGARVAGIDLAGEPLQSLAAELEGKSFAWAIGDVTDRAALTRAVDDLVARVGPIDVLIANAGIGRETPALYFRGEDVEAQLRVNLIGVANSIETVLRSMIKRRQGHLVAISSLAAYRGMPVMIGYCASKAGLNSLMEGLRLELRPRGVYVTTVCPGWIRTAMTKSMRVLQPNLMEPETASRKILRAIARRRSFYAFPFTTTWFVRLLRWLPPKASDWLFVKVLGR